MVLGFAGGEIPQIPADRLLLRNVAVVGVARGSLIEAEPGYPAEQWNDVLDYVAHGYVRPLEGEEFALADAGAALLSLAQRKTSGKVTLSMIRRDGEPIRRAYGPPGSPCPAARERGPHLGGDRERGEQRRT